MKKQKINFPTLQIIPLLAFAMLLCGARLWAQEATYSDLTLLQDDGMEHIVRPDTYTDLFIPNNTSYRYLQLRAEGADGGKKQVKELGGATRFTVNGGAGATIKAVFEIGTGENMIPPGSLVRFAGGKKGQTITAQSSSGAGGGGGSGVLFKKPYEKNWHLLIVAGGGGGAYSNCCGNKYKGRQAETGRNGSKGNGASAGDGGKNGQNGNDGEVNLVTGGGGGGGTFTMYLSGGALTGTAGWPLGDQKPDVAPYPMPGGEYYFSSARDGGNGFGGAGAGNEGGGGGGGYSGGGGGGDYNSGGGGGSYVSETLAVDSFLLANGTTSSNEDGFFDYRFTNSPSLFAKIQLAKNDKKCIDNANRYTDNGNNIRLWTCYTVSSPQSWYFDGELLRKSADKCLDLDHSNAANGTNIQLWDCNSTNAQRWIYDGVNKTIHSKVDINYCLDLKNTNITDGANIQLYSCHGGNSQKWLINGLSPDVAEVHNRIKLVGDTGKCMDVEGAGTANSTNIQVYHCHYGSSQFWNFTGNTIQFEKDPTKCLDLSLSHTYNGANIQLFDCNGTNAQKWIYDAVAGAFRSSIDVNKCIDVDHSQFEDHTNIQLWDCNGTNAQKFLLDPVDPCSHDSTPPVAKCKDFQNNGNIIPRAGDFDNGSYDNCGISSTHLESMGGGKYKITFTDPTGNSSSCTARVY